MALRFFALPAILAAACALGSCRAGGKHFDSNVARLLEENQRLERELARTKAQRDELQSKLDAGPVKLEPKALAALPVCAGIEIDSLSGFTPPDDPKRQQDASASCPAGPGAVVYVFPFDGRRRFVQIVGTLSAEAAWLPAMPEPKADQAAAPAPQPAPRTLARVTLTPEQLREAYRSGALGTNYTLRLPFENPPAELMKDPPRGALVLRVEFTDAITGRTHRAERIKNLTR